MNKIESRLAGGGGIGVAAVNGVFLVIGSVVLVYFFDLNKPFLFLNSFYFSILSLLLTVFTGRAYDVQKDKNQLNPII